MEYSEAEKQMLREVLPGIAVQLRGALANNMGLWAAWLRSGCGTGTPERTAAPPFCARAITRSCGW